MNTIDKKEIDLIKLSEHNVVRSNKDPFDIEVITDQLYSMCCYSLFGVEVRRMPAVAMDSFATLRSLLDKGTIILNPEASQMNALRLHLNNNGITSLHNILLFSKHIEKHEALLLNYKMDSCPLSKLSTSVMFLSEKERMIRDIIE